MPTHPPSAETPPPPHPQNRATSTPPHPQNTGAAIPPKAAGTGAATRTPQAAGAGAAPHPTADPPQAAGADAAIPPQADATRTPDAENTGAAIPPQAAGTGAAIPPQPGNAGAATPPQSAGAGAATPPKAAGAGAAPQTTTVPPQADPTSPPQPAGAGSDTTPTTVPPQANPGSPKRAAGAAAAAPPQADPAHRATRTPQAESAGAAPKTTTVPPQADPAHTATRTPEAENTGSATVPPQTQGAGAAPHPTADAPQADATRTPEAENAGAAPHPTADAPRAGSARAPEAVVGEVLVVGGGVIGLVVGWRVAQRGVRVVVADPSPGGGAAHVAAGMLAAVTELQYGEQALLELNRESARRYPRFAAELTELTGVDTGYRRCGTLAVALDADDRAHLRDLHAFQTSLGLEAQWLGGRDCRRLEPLLSPAVRGGLRVDGDHQVDPRRLAAALLRAAEHAGVRVVRSAVARVTTTAAGDRVTGALLADGTTVSAGRTVLAAGSESGRVAGLPDAVLPPVRPVKGQILRLRIPPSHAPFLSRTVRAVVRGSHVYLVPRSNGELVLGATSEEFGWDTTVTAGGVYELLRDAHELLPGITELPLTETLAGLRPGSPDNAPLLGRTALDGLWLATGHHRNGILLTPVTGDALADALTSPDGELPPYARAFGAGRFAGPAAADTTEATGAGDPARGPVRQEQPA